MAKPKVSAAGGMAAMLYVAKKGKQAGYLKLYQRLRSKNACKTCALGMGGQKGGMVNEAGHFPEVCKKSVQAQAGDMTAAISEEWFARTPIGFMQTRMTSADFEAVGRLTFPVIAEPGDKRFRRIGWDEALNRIAAAFKNAPPEETFWYASGRFSNEAAFLMQLVARAYGTANVHNCSFYCHQASGVALGQIYGSGTASVTLDDVEKTDLIVVVGANPASNHPRLITQLVNLRKRGGKVVVINPLKELGLLRFRIPSQAKSFVFGSQVSDLYLQPHINGDVALFVALLKGIIERGGVDNDFVSQFCTGWDDVKSAAEEASWDELIQISGVPRRDIDAAVELLCEAKRGIFCWAMGLTHHLNGVENILSLANVALSRGWLGREGCGLMPIRGHSNVQGVGSMGVAPEMKAGFARRMEELYGIKPAAQKGQDTYSSMLAAHEGRIRAAILFGGNLYASNPDSEWSARAMQNIDLVACVTTKLNEGHAKGRGKTTILLPALARDEEPQATTQESMFNYVRLSEGGKPFLEGEMRSEVEIIASLAARILPPNALDWQAMRSHERLREEIAKVVNGFEPIEQIGKTGQEFQIAGRTFHEPKFNTIDGKAHFAVTPLPAPPKDGVFRLMTIRSEGQFNSVVYDEEDLYRGNTRRDVVMLSQEDAKKIGVSEGGKLRVQNETGTMEAVAAIVEIRPGNLAMYYPEANVLVPRKLDPRSKTPAFKNVEVTLTKL
jgi:molybdopterin-dependent oxidoreductase alpha subunit